MLREAVMNSSLSRGNELLQHVRVLCVTSVAPAWHMCGIHNSGLWSVQVAIELCANCLVRELFGVECVQVSWDDGKFV